jgi:hypothetical protein
MQSGIFYFPAFQAEALAEDAVGQERLKQVIAKLETDPAKKEI